MYNDSRTWTRCYKNGISFPLNKGSNDASKMNLYLSLPVYSFISTWEIKDENIINNQ